MSNKEIQTQVLMGHISRLPKLIEAEDINGGVLRPWVRELPLRHQGVLLTAIRGCDIAPKEDNSKRLVAMIRRACLNPADGRESLAAGGFFGFNEDKLYHSILEFLHSMDHYPFHYISHVFHACEVIGYESPEYDMAMAEFFLHVYRMMVHKMHLNPESRTQMAARLTEDRVAKGTVERDF